MVILEKPVAALSRSALERFVREARSAAGLKDRANVLLTSSSAVRALNRRFRGHDKETDVLSFPAPALERTSRRRPALAGDIAISVDIAAKNAARLGHSPAQEVKVLVLHGILHLAGFDHERDNGRMARREAQLRQVLRLPVALIERAHSSGRKKVSRKRTMRYKAGAKAV
ncbi:MAG TPA: rRNA maturation RNase YbeY [Candidatus Sulfotelmatobacter sp.]|nr:rRNA maturation RNase YbeY [Candidatus Sulfotelmatobacter sp.]